MSTSGTLAPLEKWRRTLRHKPAIQKYIKLVYARFRATGEWPQIGTIQRELVQAEIEFDAYGAGTALPVELGTDPARVDGVAKLTIVAIALCPDSEPDVTAFVGFVRLCVSQYKEEGDPQVFQSKVKELLRIDDLGVRRLTRLVEWEPFVWRASVNDEIAWGVRQDLIHHFAKVKSLDDYLTTKESLQAKQPRFAPMSIQLAPTQFPMETTYPAPFVDSSAANSPAAPSGPWKSGHFRLFASHLATSKTFVGDVKNYLELLATDLFVAHADILPSREWERTILDALRTCDAIALFLVDGFRASDWTDQEFGFALARGVHVIPINLGIQPYGFAKRFQSLPAKRLDALDLAEAIFDILVNAEKTSGLMTNAVVAAVANADSATDALAAGQLLKRLSHWTETNIAQLEQALVENEAIANADDVTELINEVIHKNR